MKVKDILKKKKEKCRRCGEEEDGQVNCNHCNGNDEEEEVVCEYCGDTLEKDGSCPSCDQEACLGCGGPIVGGECDACGYQNEEEGPDQI